MNVAKIVAEDNSTFASCPEGLRRLQESPALQGGYIPYISAETTCFIMFLDHEQLF